MNEPQPQTCLSIEHLHRFLLITLLHFFCFSSYDVMIALPYFSCDGCGTHCADMCDNLWHSDLTIHVCGALLLVTSKATLPSNMLV